MVQKLKFGNLSSYKLNTFFAVFCLHVHQGGKAPLKFSIERQQLFNELPTVIGCNLQFGPIRLFTYRAGVTASQKPKANLMKPGEWLRLHRWQKEEAQAG